MSRLILCGLSLLVFTACASKAESPALAKVESVYRSALRPNQLHEETAKFLQWDQGYNLMVSDPRRGLIVTDWVQDSPYSRHRLSLRINHDVAGSLLTAHASFQDFQGGRWQEAALGPPLEKAFIEELTQYLRSFRR